MYAFLLSGNIQAQSVNDPLNKPAIWASVKSNPSDSTLWARYLGKNWVTMSNDEISKVTKWRSSLGGKAESATTAANPEPEAAWENSSQILNETQSREAQSRKTAKQNYIAQLESIMTSEPNFLSELKGNVAANFILIEDVYREEFQALGLSYTSYADTHPDGVYSQLKWVEDKTKELKSLKQKEFEKLKAQIFPGE